MSTPSPRDAGEAGPRDAAYWARQGTDLRVAQVPTGAVYLNVEGRNLVGPIQGFGPMWQKTYRVRLAGVSATPAEVMRVWKDNFARFQPRQNRFYPGLAGFQPGEVVLLNASMKGAPVDSGLMVLYADDESLTLMTPEGCPEAGWITCSVSREEDGPVAQVWTIGRSNDPIFEIGFRLAGAREQVKIWTHVLTQLAAHYGAQAAVEYRATCLDKRIQWAQVRNVWHNASVRSMLYYVAAPVRWVRRTGRR
jgi:hypothetical protein